MHIKYDAGGVYNLTFMNIMKDRLYESGLFGFCNILTLIK